MAMNVKSKDAVFQSNDFSRNYSSHHISYGNSSHYFPHIPGLESVTKTPLSLMCQQQQQQQRLPPPQPPPQPFQPLSAPQPLGPPPVMLSSPDPLRYPLCSPMPAKPHPHLQMVHSPPPVPLVSPMPPVPALPVPMPVPMPCPMPRPMPGPRPLEEECQTGGSEQDATLEELCKPLYCKLCNVTLNSAQQAQAHYQGKNHSKKLRNFYAGSQQPPPIRIPEIAEPVSQQPNSTPPTESATCKQPVSFKGTSRVILATENDYCKLCDASFSSPAVAQAHYQGKNHAKRLRLAEAQQSGSHLDCESGQRRTRKEGSEYRLIKNRRALHTPPVIPGPYYNPRPRQRIPRDLAMCVTPSGQFYCSMCNSGASEEADFRLHLESKQHKSKVSEQRYRSEMETLGYT
ncbi:zinc finger matrin-type protein 3 [Clupea harengus]|uniref:Zinc finger matrin-type protein 3 n=1 Tax=Clupea harengus TaxID=7950 RepID=A0A6P8G6I9_CLUHA|nr:zinc finger matrin-type protein 3 [Clupea harengus]